MAAQQTFGARLSYSKIPLFNGLEALLEQGLCPLGTQRNLETAAPLTTFTSELNYNNVLLLADAQTSGGLLMAVPKAHLAALLAELKAHNVTSCAVIGQVTLSDQSANIEVEL